MVVFKSCHDKDYIVWNTHKDFSNKKEKGHGHLKSLKMAKQICRNIVDEKMPKSRLHYILICHVRCSDKNEYNQKIETLLATRRQKGKTLGYKNSSY